jgi:hypothetical protein
VLEECPTNRLLHLPLQLELVPIHPNLMVPVVQRLYSSQERWHLQLLVGQNYSALALQIGQARWLPALQPGWKAHPRQDCC